MATQNSNFQRSTRNHPIISDGFLLAFLSGFAVSISLLMTKLAKNSTFLQITFLRTTLIGCSTLLFEILGGHWSRFRDALLDSPTNTFEWCFTLSVSSIGTALKVYQRIHMGDEASVIFGVITTPVFTGLMGIYLLGEAWQRKHMYLTFIAWTGVALICKPLFLSRYFDWTAVIIIPIAASRSVYKSKTLYRTAPLTLVICITSIGSAMYSCFFMAMLDSVRLPPFADWKYLIPEVIAGLVSEISFAKALQLERAAPVTLMRSLTICVSFVSHLLFFGTVRSRVNMLGVCLVLVSANIAIDS